MSMIFDASGVEKEGPKTMFGIHTSTYFRTTLASDISGVSLIISQLN